MEWQTETKRNKRTDEWGGKDRGNSLDVMVT